MTADFCAKGGAREIGTRGAGAWRGKSTVWGRSSRLLSLLVLGSLAFAGTSTQVTLSANNRVFISRRLGQMSGVQTITVTNNLNTELLFSSIATSGDFAVASNSCGSGIGAGLNCTIGITFTPTALGPRQGTLTISYNASGSPGLVALSGTGNDTGLTSISVTPANPSIAVGTAQQFTATGTFSDGTTPNLTPFVTWSSSALGVATITAGGLAAGTTAGSSTISATISGISGSTTLTVNSATVASNAPADWLEFVGDGSEGAYSCTSGTCVLGGEHWFSSFVVSAGASVVNAGQNSPIVIRSAGACTVAGTISNSPDSGGGVTAAGDFGAGGGGGGGGTLKGHAGYYSVGPGTIEIISQGSGGAASGGNGGNGAVPATGQYHQLLSGGSFWPVGGSAGGVGGSSGGAGGLGGAPIILVCDSINFTGTIDVSGGPGGDSPANNSGAGGGGGAGYVIFSGASYTANRGTINLSGGVGGSCNSNSGCGTGGNGGNGWNKVITIP